MKKISIGFFVAMIILVLAACKTQKSSTVNSESKLPETNSCLPLQLADKAYGEIASDPFQLEQLTIDKTCLRAIVSYGGGCRTVRWEAYFNQLVRHSFPPQIDLKLVLHNGDPCRAIVTDTVMVNLDELEAMARSGGVVIGISGHKSTVLYALPLN